MNDAPAGADERRAAPIFADAAFRIGCVFLFWILFSAAVRSEWEASFPAIDKSEAYQAFKKRSYSELSKLAYLIDRYKDTKIRVLYDGAYYDTALAVRVARWFLPRHYRGEKAEAWVARHCATSFIFGNPILIKFPDGSTRPAADMLLAELKSLDETYARDKAEDHP